jgi:type II secretion system protein N
MRFWKNKIFWLTIYAVLITCVFFYFLFPSELILRQLESSTASSEFVLKAADLRPSLPLGIKLQDLTASSASTPADLLLQFDQLDWQFSLWSIFQKSRYIHFNGQAYGGDFNGRAAFISFTQFFPPVEGQINFQNIDLTQYNQADFPLIKGMAGRARGSLIYSSGNKTSHDALGKLSLHISRGAYPLAEPFLGLNRIEFDRGEMQAQLEKGSVIISNLEIYGARMNCLLSGSIALADRVEESRLNLKGVLEIVGPSKTRMNIMVGGTLARPAVRYI